MDLVSPELSLQPVDRLDRAALRAQQIFDEIFRSGLPDRPGRAHADDRPILSAELPGLLGQVKELEEALKREGSDPTNVVQLRVNLLFARGFATRLKAQHPALREHFLVETLPVLWWIDLRFGYNPFEHLDEALDDDELEHVWQTALRTVIDLAHTVDPPSPAPPSELLRAVQETGARDLRSDAGDWPILARGLYRVVQQPEERYPLVAALLTRCRSPLALSYVASLDALRNNPRLLASLMERAGLQAAMVALVAYARSDKEVAVRRLVRRQLAVAEPPVPSERLASLYGWLDVLGEPDVALSDLLMELAVQRLRDEKAARPLTDETALARVDHEAFRSDRLYGEAARRLDGPARNLASARVLARMEARLTGLALQDGRLDPRWCGRMSRAVRNACAPWGQTDTAMVPHLVRAVHRASEALAREVPVSAVAHTEAAKERVRAYVELLILVARRLPDDETGRTLARTLLGAALATVQQRDHMVRDMPILLILEHVEATLGPAPPVRDALSLVAARPFLERWRALEHGRCDLSGPADVAWDVVELTSPLDAELVPADLYEDDGTVSVEPERLTVVQRLRHWLRRLRGQRLLPA
jgi:hypothetical protein